MSNANFSHDECNSTRLNSFYQSKKYTNMQEEESYQQQQNYFQTNTIDNNNSLTKTRPSTVLSRNSSSRPHSRTLTNQFNIKVVDSLGETKNQNAFNSPEKVSIKSNWLNNLKNRIINRQSIDAGIYSLKPGAVKLITAYQKCQNDFIKNIQNQENHQVIFQMLIDFLQINYNTIKDIEIFIKQIIFGGQVSEGLGDADKAIFFYHQALIVADNCREVNRYNAEILLLLGNISCKMQQFDNALKFYKKALQYAWYYKNTEIEISIYDQLGICYYYLSEIKLSIYFHRRAMLSDIEEVQSPQRKISFEVLNSYFQKQQLFDTMKLSTIMLSILSIPIYENSPDDNNSNIDEFQYTYQTILNNSNNNFQQQNYYQQENSKTINISQLLEQNNQKKNEENKSDNKQNEVYNLSQLAENFQKHQALETYNAKMDLYHKAQAQIETQQIMQDDKFLFEMDTPKHSFQQQNQQMFKNFNDSNNKFVSPRSRMTIFDTSKLGPQLVGNQYEQMYEKMATFKFSIEKQLDIRQQMKFDLQESLQSAYDRVGQNIRYKQDLKQVVLKNHLSEKRSFRNKIKLTTLQKNVSKVKNLYFNFINELLCH